MHLGVNEETAAEDACRMEHVISDESFEKMKAYFPSISKKVGRRFDEGEFILAYNRENGKKRNKGRRPEA